MSIALALVFEDLSAQSGPAVWIVPSLQRVGPTDAAGSSSAAQISAARGETESFQIIVRAPDGNGLSNVNATVTDLTGPGTIAKSNISLYREHYVSVSPGSPELGRIESAAGSRHLPGSFDSVYESCDWCADHGRIGRSGALQRRHLQQPADFGRCFYRAECGSGTIHGNLHSHE